MRDRTRPNFADMTSEEINAALDKMTKQIKATIPHSEDGQEAPFALVVLADGHPVMGTNLQTSQAVLALLAGAIGRATRENPTHIDPTFPQPEDN